jgi:methyl-accepting chemotaxis protein
MFKGLSLKSGGLKTKLMVAGCLMAIVPVVVLGAMAVYNAKTTMEKEAEQQMLTVSKSIADMVDGVMTSESNAIAMLAQRDAVIEAIKEKNAGGEGAKTHQLQQELGRLAAITEGRYEAIIIIPKDGVVFADNVKGGTKGINVVERDYFKRAMQGKANLDMVVMSKKSNTPVSNIAHPVKDESGQVIGVVAGIMNVSFLTAKINEVKLGKTGYAFIVNKEGTVIAYPDLKQVLQLNMAKVEGLEELMRRCLAGEVGAQEYTYKGIHKFAGFAPVKSNGWSVVTSLPSDEALAAANATRNIIFIGVIFFALLAAVASWFSARAIAVPIQKASERLNAGAEQITAASGEVASASQSLAEGASEQAAAIEETSSSLEEMSSMTKQNADNAGTANKLMEETKVVVSRANESMKNLTGSMDEITKASEDTSKIIKTIDEIAFQTNLLALNAAVEAARAGEAGAGFAVVAEEVRNLAIRAADAARNTSGLIEGTIKKIKDGADLVGRTNEDFSHVAESAAKVASLIGEIAAASDEQAQGIGQISKAVHEMDKVVQQNAANAEESASASEEMNAQAVTMKDVVGELVAVIGGSSNGGPMPLHEEAAFKPRLPLVARKTGRTKAATPAQAAAKELRPDQVIPLDDPEFKNF